VVVQAGERVEARVEDDAFMAHHVSPVPHHIWKYRTFRHSTSRAVPPGRAERFARPGSTRPRPPTVAGLLAVQIREHSEAAITTLGAKVTPNLLILAGTKSFGPLLCYFSLHV